MKKGDKEIDKEKTINWDVEEELLDLENGDFEAIIKRYKSLPGGPERLNKWIDEFLARRFDTVLTVCDSAR